VRERVLQVVFGASAVIIAASLAVLLLLSGRDNGGGSAQSTGASRSAARQSQRITAATKEDARLDVDALQLIPDDEIEMVLMEFIWLRIGDDYSREYEAVTELSPGLQMLYTTWTVETEVNNGGFDQYFINTNGTLAAEALEGFRLLRARAHARIMENAIALYAKEHPEASRLRLIAPPIDSLSYTDFESLDKAFYSISTEENLRQMRIDYIRQHPDQFTGAGFAP
jgi:hypothetical protein